MTQFKVLSTKKLSSALVSEAKQHNIQIVEDAFISVQPITTKEKIQELIDLADGGNEYVAFTSANAVMPFQGDETRPLSGAASWKIFCLQGNTKQAVSGSLFSEKNIVATAENAKALAQKIIDRGIEKIIFFCGNRRRNELPGMLKAAGIMIKEVVVYKTVAIPKIAGDDIDAILFFSPSAVHSFFSVNELNARTVCFSIGETTAAAIAGFTGNKIITTKTPTQEAMMASVNYYFQNINCYE